jgi:hypothetical protein
LKPRKFDFSGLPQTKRTGTVRRYFSATVKLLTAITLPFLIISCELTSTAIIDAPAANLKTPAEPETPVEKPIAEVDDGMTFAKPNTTGKLLTDEDSKTVAGPVPVKVPEPTEDSAIDIEPSLPSPPSED